MVVTLEQKRSDIGERVAPVPIGFIGSGKVGTALAALLYARGVAVVAVSGRAPEDGREMAWAAGLGEHAASDIAGTALNADIVFLTVPDDVIGPLCLQIAEQGLWRAGQGVVHCSGALSSNVLEPAREMGALVASFHPLQTFASLDAALLHMTGSTFALEGDEKLVRQLTLLVELLGGTSLQLKAEEKTLYHAAAAIASNYTVTLAALASELLVREGIAVDPNIALRYLMPLLRGTVDNLNELGLPGALTGPMSRGDVGTVKCHLDALEGRAPEMAHLYRHLARLTLPLAIAKGHLASSTIEEMERLLGSTD